MEKLAHSQWSNHHSQEIFVLPENFWRDHHLVAICHAKSKMPHRFSDQFDRVANRDRQLKVISLLFSQALVYRY